MILLCTDTSAIFYVCFRSCLKREVILGNAFKRFYCVYIDFKVILFQPVPTAVATSSFIKFSHCFEREAK